MNVELRFDDDTLDAIAARAAEMVLAEIDHAAAKHWPEWMSADTAARYLDVTVERIRKLKERNAIPYSQEGPGCRVFFRRAALDEWMQRHVRANR